VKFNGLDVFADDVVEKLFGQNMLKQLEYIRDFIKLNIVKSYLPELGSAYEYNYPAKALEELIYNAIIHNDYTVNAPIKIYEFQDRIEITNNGGLYGNATQNFPYNTDYRNPIIASAAKVLGFVNRFGVGVQRAMAELQNNGNAAPEFITDQAGKFVVKVWAKK
jgi:ATP-dependent DNA helicase RecG